MRRYAVRFVAVGIVALALTACSSGGNGTDAAAPTTTAGLGGPGTQPVDTKFTGVGSAEYCRLAQDPLSKIAPNASSDLRQVLDDAARDLQGALAVAPAEIKGDVQTIASVFTALVDEFRRVNYVYTALRPEVVVRLMAPEVVAASTRLAAYRSNVCGTK